MSRFWTLAAVLSVALFLSFATTGCELEGGESGADADATSNNPSEISVAIFNDAFNVNGQEVTSVNVAVGGGITFNVPSASPVANVVITSLGVDVAIEPGNSFRQPFTAAGTYTVTDQNSGSVPSLTVFVQ